MKVYVLQVAAQIYARTHQFDMANLYELSDLHQARQNKMQRAGKSASFLVPMVSLQHLTVGMDYPGRTKMLRQVAKTCMKTPQTERKIATSMQIFTIVVGSTTWMQNELPNPGMILSTVNAIG